MRPDRLQRIAMHLPLVGRHQHTFYLWYFKLRFFNSTDFIVLNIKGCKDIWNRKSEFVTKIQFLSWYHSFLIKIRKIYIDWILGYGRLLDCPSRGGALRSCARGKAPPWPESGSKQQSAQWFHPTPYCLQKEQDQGKRKKMSLNFYKLIWKYWFKSNKSKEVFRYLFKY